MSFDKWDHRFMEMAHIIAGWTSCFAPGRAIGAVIVRDKRIMTTGYNGAPAGMKTCKERGYCLRRRMNIPSGTRAESATPSTRSRTPSSRRPSWACASKARPCTARTSPAPSARR